MFLVAICGRYQENEDSEHISVYLTSSKCILFFFSEKRLISKGSNFKLPESVKVLTTQSCLTLCNPMDCSPPGFSFHRILQARILEWVTIPFSRGSSQPRGQNWVSCTAGRFFIVWVTRVALFYICACLSFSITFSVKCYIVTHTCVSPEYVLGDLL